MKGRDTSAASAARFRAMRPGYQRTRPRLNASVAVEPVVAPAPEPPEPTNQITSPAQSGTRSIP